MGEQENFDQRDEDANTAAFAAANIGLTLHEARQQRNLTLEDVEKDTKIRVRYLEAMERGDYAVLPGAVYAQGFLKTYANYLNLDGEKLAQNLKDRPETSRPTAGPEETRISRGSRLNDRPGAGRLRRRRNGILPRVSPLVIIGSVLALILLTVVVGGLYFIGLRASSTPDNPAPNAQVAENAPDSNQNNNASPNLAAGTTAETTNEPIPGTSENVESVEPSGQQTSPQGTQEAGQTEASPNGASDETQDGQTSPSAPPGPPPAETLTMEVRVENNISWLNIEVDGNAEFVQVAEPGFVQTFEGEESITVWSGNAGAVFLSVNGQDYGRFGGSGQTKIQEFNLKTAEN